MDKSKTIVIKYGGNAMVNNAVREKVLNEIADLHKTGHRVVLVHGGGPFINALLDELNLDSEFVAGHRKTTDQTIKYIEMALTGEVNPILVRSLVNKGTKAVGVSGKDGGLIRATRKFHEEKSHKVDIGWVGEVSKVDTSLLDTLLEKGMLPVMTCMASDEDGNAYNINGDMVGGHIAGALNADHYLVMTDVDGLFMDINDSASLIQQLKVSDIENLIGKVIQDGMIPKMDSCVVALNEGAKSVGIINGTKAGSLTAAVKEMEIGTKITK